MPLFYLLEEGDNHSSGLLCTKSMITNACDYAGPNLLLYSIKRTIADKSSKEEGRYHKSYTSVESGVR